MKSSKLNAQYDFMVIEGYKFGYHKTLKNDILRFKCTNKKCNSYFKMDELKNIISDVTLHNHIREEERTISRQIISNNVKRKAMEDISIKPDKLICKELDNGNPVTVTIPDLHLIRKNLNFARKSKFPSIPKNIEDVHMVLNSIDTPLTVEKESFVLVNDNISNIILFSCEKNLRFLSSLNTIYVDGTFKYCTKFFLQMFTIHGFLNDYYIPLVFILLPNKNINSYAKAFQYINEECLKLRLHFNPDIVYADYEGAIHRAINIVWPKAEIKGCRFHLAQSWYVFLYTNSEFIIYFSYLIIVYYT